MRAVPVLLSVCAVVAPLVAFAQTEPTTSPGAAPSASASATPTVKPATSSTVTLTGYVEGFYQWNFNRPSNDVTALRAFDTRHDSFTLANAVIDAAWSLDKAYGRLALQVGHTPETYYLAEPSTPAQGGVGASSPQVWKLLQQANVGVKLTDKLSVEGGLFLSPVGPESMAIKDQWNWSRSNLFYALPFYHTGARSTYAFSDTTSVMLMVSNGWNSVVDNNKLKSVTGSFSYAIPDKAALQLLYFGGFERPTGAPEGDPWRHLFDAYVTVYPTPRLALLAHGDVGFEKNHFGTSSWYAGALSARFKATDWLYVAARGDRFHEKAPSNASRIFWPSDWVSSGTFTLDLRPAETASIRLEYRHDAAQGDSFFGRGVPADGSFNRKFQNTLTLGATTWF